MASHAMSSEEIPTQTAPEKPLDQTNVQVLSESGIQDVPPMFIRTAEELATISPYTSLDIEQIPVIDLDGLHDFRRVFTMSAIASACKDWGFFQVENHDIPLPLLEGALKVSRQFFDLSLKEKDAYAIDCTEQYASGYGRQFLESEYSVVDWNDVMFHYFLPLDQKHMDSWPSKPNAYRETLDAYGNAVRNLLESLMEVFSQELGFRPTYLKDVVGEPEQPLRINHYPKCPQPELVLGLQGHTDPHMLTALLQDGTPGLQIQKGGKWVGVDPDVEAIVISVGDQLQIASNGRFKSVKHRVVVNKIKDRISLATGLAPNANSVVGPARELVSKTSPALFESHSYAEYKAALPKIVRW